MKKTIHIVFSVLIMAMILSGCSILSQKKFAYLKKVPVQSVSEINEHHLLSEPYTENKLAAENNKKGFISENDPIEVEIKNTASKSESGIFNTVTIPKLHLIPKYHRMRAGLSHPLNENDDGLLISIILAILFIAMAILLFIVLGGGCLGYLVLIMFLILAIFAVLIF
ncbi:MAG: hypothetical protein C0592_03505 [Marinilabiliales bacterium]|nr:MAG: hypothetical protein C0592_03505 [Marinilabiliales bacterium]